jgi:DNA-binding NtrC family response regulator
MNIFPSCIFWPSGDPYYSDDLEVCLDKPRGGAVTAIIFRTESPSKRLLFVDDEEGIRLTLPQILQRRGFEVWVAASVPEALAEINNHEFDVLLSDLNIGKEGDGFAVVRAMREVHPNCVTILLTGYPAIDTAVQAIREQADDYFVKPAEIDELVGSIERRLTRRAKA